MAETNEEVPVAGPNQAQNDQPEPATFGFDPAGKYFGVRADARYGKVFILGLLVEAAFHLYSVVAAAEMRKREEGLIKPVSKKGGMGRFNIFK